MMDNDFLQQAIDAYNHEGGEAIAQAASLISIAQSLVMLVEQGKQRGIEAGMDVTGWHIMAEHWQREAENLRFELDQAKRPSVFTDGERLVVLDHVAGFKPLPDKSLAVYSTHGNVTFNPEYAAPFIAAYRAYCGLPLDDDGLPF
jgi:hypothetical protein